MFCVFSWNRHFSQKRGCLMNVLCTFMRHPRQQDSCIPFLCCRLWIMILTLLYSDRRGGYIFTDSLPPALIGPVQHICIRSLITLSRQYSIEKLRTKYEKVLDFLWIHSTGIDISCLNAVPLTWTLKRLFCRRETIAYPKNGFNVIVIGKNTQLFAQGRNMISYNGCPNISCRFPDM